MSQTSIERLRDYLAQLPPQSQALLMREFERALERGEDTSVATFVLEQLRWVVRARSPPHKNRGGRRRSGGGRQAAQRRSRRGCCSARWIHFLSEAIPLRPGQVRRSSLLPVWQWLARDGAPEQVREFEAALERSRQSGNSHEVEVAVRKLQLAAADAILKIAGPSNGGDKQRALARVGPPDVIEDLLPIG